MKYFILFFTLFLCNLSFSQNFYLKIKGKNELETKQIDSLNYKSQHNLVADILKEKEKFDLNEIKVRQTPSQATDKPISFLDILRVLFTNIFNPLGLLIIFVTVP
mgnify:CR=1 FL=1